MKKSILQLKEIEINFGGVVAVKDINFEIYENEILSIIGPNGAGKTTLFNIISGYYRPSKGTILLNGKPIKDSIKLKTILINLIYSFTLGFLGIITINSQELWTLAITDQYIIGEKFNYANSVKLSLAHLSSLDSIWTIIPFIIFSTIIFLSLYKILKENLAGLDVSSRHGLSRTFQNIRLLPELKSRENIGIGVTIGRGPINRQKTGGLSRGLILPENKRSKLRKDKALTFLEITQMLSESEIDPTTLNYGHQRKIEISRSISTEPKIILLDEPAAGMNDKEADELGAMILSLKSKGYTIIMIEHHMSLVMKYSDRIIVMNNGSIIADGLPNDIANNKIVKDAYLGNSA